MQVLLLTLLLLVAPAVMTQQLIVPEDSMREAWSNSTGEEEFDSLSSDYDTYSRDGYGYPGRDSRYRSENTPPASNRDSDTDMELDDAETDLR